jgi:hypothetical protein
MHTTLELVGNPVDQFVEAAFQLVVPETGPCQLSVHIGKAALGGAVAKAATPTPAMVAPAKETAPKTLRSPPMIVHSVSGSHSCPSRNHMPVGHVDGGRPRRTVKPIADPVATVAVLVPDGALIPHEMSTFEMARLTDSRSSNSTESRPCRRPEIGKISKTTSGNGD